MIAMIVAVIVLAVINFAYKAAGPAVLGDLEFPPRTQSVVDALPAALLAGLLVVDLLGQHWQDFDWTVLPGLGVAVVLRVSGRSHLLCIVAGVACAAVLRIWVLLARWPRRAAARWLTTSTGRSTAASDLRGGVVRADGMAGPELSSQRQLRASDVVA
jgi:branched-subunit amino acid transport protein